MKKCALCGNKAELKTSHIIPKFTTNWLKNTAITGFLRKNEDNYKQRQQDGYKEELLCFDCEQLFSKCEKEFSEKIFKPYLEENKTKFIYEEWLNYFITSVNWRILYLQIVDSLKGEITLSLANIEELSTAAKTLGDFLLKKQGFPQEVETHLYFINDFAFLKQANLNPISFFKRSVFGSISEGEQPYQYCYIYTNLCGILIVTIIKKTPIDTWQNTLISTSGVLNTSQLMGSPVLGELILTLEEANTSNIPDNQVSKIINNIQKDNTKVQDSKFIDEYSKDIELKDLHKKIFNKD